MIRGVAVPGDHDSLVESQQEFTPQASTSMSISTYLNKEGNSSTQSDFYDYCRNYSNAAPTTSKQHFDSVDWMSGVRVYIMDMRIGKTL